MSYQQGEEYRVVRRSKSLGPLYAGMAHQIQAEYDHWIGEERRLRDLHDEAEQQVEIREVLLEKLRAALNERAGF